MSELETGTMVDNFGAGLDPALETGLIAEDQGYENSDVDSFEDLEPDKLMDLVKSTKAELQKAEKAKRELQSLHDRQNNDIRERQARLEGELAAMRNQPRPEVGVSDDVARRTKELKDKWRQDIAENPDKAVDYIDGFSDDVADYINQKVSETRETIADIEKRYEDKFAELDPVYRENKETVENVMKEMSVNRQKAIAIVNLVNNKKTEVRQPGIVPPPSVVSDSGRMVNRRAEPAGVSFDSTLSQIHRMTGLSSKDIKDISSRTAKSLNGR